MQRDGEGREPVQPGEKAPRRQRVTGAVWRGRARVDGGTGRGGRGLSGRGGCGLSAGVEGENKAKAVVEQEEV